MDTLEELRALRRDLDELGDSVAVVLLERAERCFLSWHFEAGERYMEQALSRVQGTIERQPEAHGAARYFASSALAVADGRTPSCHSGSASRCSRKRLVK